jgi:hypothetical protein
MLVLGRSHLLYFGKMLYLKNLSFFAVAKKTNKKRRLDNNNYATKENIII